MKPPLNSPTRSLKNWLKTALVVALSANICTLSAHAEPRAKQQQNTANQDAQIDVRVETLIAKMTIEEKVAQMRIFHAQIGVENGPNGELILSDEVKAKLKNGIAGIKNPGEHISPQASAKHNNMLQKYIIENSRLGIPALFVAEAYNGVDAKGSTKFPRPLNMAATFNPELVQRAWSVVGREARLRGFHMCHSPEADIVRDPRFGRMSEAFGEDTHLVTEMVVNAVKGVQGDYIGLKGTHIGAVTKHFAGYGQIEGGRNFASVQISPRDLVDEIYPPFKGAVQRGRSLGIMASHGDINGIASHANKDLLTTTLRDEWGFKGYIVSDAQDVARLYFFMGVAQNEDEAALMGLNAGVDIDLYSEDAYSRLPALVEKHPEIIANIDDAVRHVLRTKFILGLFDNPYIDVKQTAELTRSQAHLDLALETALESIILLKNDGNVLPIDTSVKQTIALIGPLVETNTVAEFQAVLGNNVTLIAEKGFVLTDENEKIPMLISDDINRPGMQKAIDVAKQADTVILFLGGDHFTAKEGFFNGAYGDRANIDPTGLQDELMTKVSALGKPTIVALKHRRTLSINVIDKLADGILDAWDLGEHADTALAMMVNGDVVPSGKLPVTVPRSIGQIPFHYSQKDINFKKGYLFIEDGPIYPFGYGLSYANFDYKNLSLSTNKIKSDGKLQASIELTNTSAVDAKEVVQLYIRDKIGSVLRPKKMLKAFDKVLIAAGETKTVRFEITSSMLTMTGADMMRKVEPGEFEVQIGGSSNTSTAATFSVYE